ncbi:tyrosine-type recombinase/integrase [Paraburkholderia phenoliruptrix]|uniref:tyrosine-type recombinase/integrase n=1 Tax=Paraburkholderia phenoliruptrix TaxID=252970 RepID=UPI001C6E135D|nr:site-specific integrase [Paraburkholderia phenoliruptrix]MBW9107394.1 tyrosine-type recombinase/integrase [Paraburkholderia phenoliruptrix]MBW9128184.1 tyrosine-type recombinase/integrase [Paraburkholderia ginsengiterrae]
MLTDLELRALRPTGRIYKVTDQRGLYVAVTSAGAVSFRFDYRLNGRRETLVIGRYDPGLPARGARAADELSFGMSMRLAEARLLLERARREVEQGASPSRSKVEKRVEAADAMTFGKWAEKYFLEAKLAESTRAMRKSVYDRNLAAEFGRLKLEEITSSRLLMRCEKIKERGAAAPAVQARDIVLQVYRFVQARGLKVANPAEDIRPSAIATFKPRDRALTPAEIHVFFKALERTPTLPTLRLAVKFMLLTMVRKSEFILATWDEVDFNAATWTIPKDRMKGGRPHNVYLSEQALDILVTFKTCFGASSYLHPGRYELELPISAATLNRVIDSAVRLIRESGTPDFESFSVHDLRRTASTQLHEAGFNSDWIEKCLAHEQRGVRAVYNKAEYAEQRRGMLQTWAEMLDGWIVKDPAKENGAGVRPTRSPLTSTA